MGVSRIRSLSPRYLGVPSVYLVQFRIYAGSVSQNRWYPASLLHTVAVIDRESAEPRGRRSTIHGFPSPSPILFDALCPSRRRVLSVVCPSSRPLYPILLLLLLLLRPTSLFRLLYCLESLHRGCIPFPVLIET